MAARDAEGIVIVGGGPAGFATARAYRKAGGREPVTIVCEEPLLPYQRPPLTKGLLRGDADVDELPLAPASWFRAHGVRARIGIAAAAVDPGAMRVRLADGEELPARAIVLATGSEPTPAPFPGAGHPRVGVIRRVADGLRARALAGGASATVVGGGFIASEAAASLAMRGAAVTLVDRERLPQLERIGEHAAMRIRDWLRELGVEHLGETEVEAIEDDGRVTRLAGGRRLSAAYTLLATGVRPRGELAAAAGLAMAGGAVEVDERLAAAGAGRILAAGDVARARNAAAGRPLRVEHWGDALGQGDVAGRVLAGEDVRWDAVPGFWSTIGERTIKYTGWGEGWGEARVVDHGDAFTVWYARDGVTVGALTHERDEDYQRAAKLIAGGAPPP